LPMVVKVNDSISIPPCTSYSARAPATIVHTLKVELHEAVDDRAGGLAVSCLLYEPWQAVQWRQVVVLPVPTGGAAPLSI
jgi:DNA-directed RNA polymerase subunit E'/Rpb7